MGFMRILLIYCMFYYFTIAGAKDDIACFSDSNSEYIKKGRGETVDLIFMRDKSPIENSQLIYYSKCGASSSQAAIIQSEMVYTLMDPFTDKGTLVVKEDRVIYTITNTNRGDSGVYLFRQNAYHAERHLVITDKHSDENLEKKPDTYDQGMKMGLLSAFLIILIVVVLLFIGWFIWGKKYFKIKRQPRKSQEPEVVYTSYGDFQGQLNPLIVPANQVITHRNLITEEASKNIEFMVTKLTPNPEVKKPDYHQSLQPRKLESPITANFMSLPVDMKTKSAENMHKD